MDWKIGSAEKWSGHFSAAIFQVAVVSAGKWPFFTSPFLISRSRSLARPLTPPPPSLSPFFYDKRWKIELYNWRGIQKWNLSYTQCGTQYSYL